MSGPTLRSGPNAGGVNGAELEEALGAKAGVPHAAPSSASSSSSTSSCADELDGLDGDFFDDLPDTDRDPRGAP
jgi:hypothetical protein